LEFFLWLWDKAVAEGLFTETKQYRGSNEADNTRHFTMCMAYEEWKVVKPPHGSVFIDAGSGNGFYAMVVALMHGSNTIAFDYQRKSVQESRHLIPRLAQLAKEYPDAPVMCEPRIRSVVQDIRHTELLSQRFVTQFRAPRTMRECQKFVGEYKSCVEQLACSAFFLCLLYK